MMSSLVGLGIGGFVLNPNLGSMITMMDIERGNIINDSHFLIIGQPLLAY